MGCVGMLSLKVGKSSHGSGEEWEMRHMTEDILVG